jgi:hypothetical protein
MRRWCILAVVALAFAAGGCDSSNPVTIEGRAVFPNSIGNGPVADSPILILQMEDVLAGPYTSGTTDGDGNYRVVVDSAGSVAIIVRGNVGGIDVRISGLTTTGADARKNFNGVTDIACQAAVLAVRDGSITGEQVDDMRIMNLEGAAAEVAGATDFLDAEAVTRSAETVRNMTNDGAVSVR